MSEPIVAEWPFLDDFLERFTSTEADDLLGVTNGTVGAAMDRGELEYFLLPGKKQRFTCRRMLNDWIRRFCLVEVQHV